MESVRPVLLATSLQQTKNLVNPAWYPMYKQETYQAMILFSGVMVTTVVVAALDLSLIVNVHTVKNASTNTLQEGSVCSALLECSPQYSLVLPVVRVVLQLARQW